MGVRSVGTLVNFLLPFLSPGDEYDKEKSVFSGQAQLSSFTLCSTQTSHLARSASLSGPLSPPEAGSCRCRYLRFRGWEVSENQGTT